MVRELGAEYLLVGGIRQADVSAGVKFELIFGYCQVPYIQKQLHIDFN